MLKNLIIHNSTLLFAQNGYSKTSIQKIADSCETSQTNVLYHFKTKKNLFEACLNTAINNNKKNIERFKSKDPKEKLINFLNTYVNWALESPHECQLFLLMFYFSSNDKNFLKLSEKVTKNGEISLKKYLLDLDLKGSSINEVVLFIQSYIHGVMFNILGREDKIRVFESYKNSLNTLIDSFFL